MPHSYHTKNRDFIGSVIAFFSSVYLTLVMLGLITFFSLMGVMGQIQGVYHTKYFRLLLGILFINLIVCTLQRLPKAYRRVRMDSRDQAPPPPRQADIVLRVESNDPEEVRSGAEKIAFGKSRRIKRREMIWPVKKEGHGSPEPSRISFYSRGRWSLLGPHVTHLGILIILIGGIIGSRYSMTAGVFLKPGDKTGTVNMKNDIAVQLGFTVQCNNFRIERYENQQPADFIADLSIIDAGKVVKQKEIEVNKPLYYGGFGIYQSSYEKDHKFRLIARPTKDGDTLGKNVRLREPWTISGTSVSFMIVDYTPSSRGMGRSMGPRAIVIKYKDREPVRQISLFEEFPEFDSRRGGDYMLSFKRIESGYVTGLRFMKDPGTPVIWAGSILLILGVLQSFMVKHRRAWLITRKADGEVELALAARSYKARSMLLAWEESVVEKLQNELGARLEEQKEENASSKLKKKRSSKP